VKEPYSWLDGPLTPAQPHKSCTSGKAAEHHVNVSLADTGLLPYERRELLYLLSEAAWAAATGEQQGLGQTAGLVCLLPSLCLPTVGW